MAVIETDKVNVDIRSTDSGVIKKFFANEGDTVAVDSNFFEIDTDAKGGQTAAKSTSDQPKKEAEPKKVLRRYLNYYKFRRRPPRQPPKKLRRRRKRHPRKLHPLLQKLLQPLNKRLAKLPLQLVALELKLESP